MAETLVDQLAAYGRSARFRHAYVGGTFDCLHRGHLALLAATRRLACTVTVGVNSDDFATRYKRKPLMPYADRVAVLQQCRLVDQVVLNVGHEDSRPAIEFATDRTYGKVDLVTHGTDWDRKGLLVQMTLTEDWLKARGIVLALLHTPVIHTTEILRDYDAHRLGRPADSCPLCGVLDHEHGAGD